MRPCLRPIAYVVVLNSHVTSCNLSREGSAAMERSEERAQLALHRLHRLFCHRAAAGQTSVADASDGLVLLIPHHAVAAHCPRQTQPDQRD